jgi:hypothetical protein
LSVVASVIKAAGEAAFCFFSPEFYREDTGFVCMTGGLLSNLLNKLNVHAQADMAFRFVGSSFYNPLPVRQSMMARDR